MNPPAGAEVELAGRRLRVSNLDKVLWPATGFTKGDMIDYYTRVAPVMLPHLAGRAITLRRWPDGVGGASWYEKHAPSHRPDWVGSVEMGGVAYCRLDEPAALVWTANLAAIELHPTLAVAADLERPTSVVFDLDPGPPADAVAAGVVAGALRVALERLGLQAWVKTSGSKGLQVYVPLNGPADYSSTKAWSLALAQVLERAHPDLVVTTQDRSARPGRVLIDWSQNSASKTTVAAYSLRALPAPGVSTPLTWEELDSAVASGDAAELRFSPAEVLERVERHGDLMAPLLELRQELPALG